LLAGLDIGTEKICCAIGGLSYELPGDSAVSAADGDPSVEYDAYAEQQVTHWVIDPSLPLNSAQAAPLLFDEYSASDSSAYAPLQRESIQDTAQTQNSSPWKIELLGFGQHASCGVGPNGITNIDLLEGAVLSAVYAAEETAKKNIKDVYINVPVNLIKTYKVQTSISLSGQNPVQTAHMRKLFSLSKSLQVPPSQHIIHIWPLSYKLDDMDHIADPVGMIGKDLSALCYIVTAPKSYITNVTRCVGKCNLDVAGFVADVYADGLACLADDEAELGATLVNIGGKVTQIACFSHGNLVWMDSAAIGGFHITSDLARILSTTIPQAERMKTLYGGLLESSKKSFEQVPFSQIANKNSPSIEYVPRSLVLDVIKARLDDIFDWIIAVTRKIPANIDKAVLQKVVFTGGSCGFHGLTEFAEQRLGVNVRVSPQNGILGVDRILNSTAISTCSGLLHYAASEYIGEKNDKKPLNFWQKMSLWLNEHL
jgi:cell division protein FtsA